MSVLLLSDDELALLRFTCDLFFVEESPLWPIEQSAREPTDTQAAYDGLVQRGIIDPNEFRMVDAALNRVAPVTECDAHITHVVTRGNGASQRVASKRVSYFVMDEIAVAYQRTGGTHVFGVDLDGGQLVEELARHVVARRAGGDYVDVTLTPVEFMVMSALLSLARVSQSRAVAVEQLRRALAKPPPHDGIVPTFAAAPMLARRPPPRARTGALLDDATWDDALRSTMEKGLVRVQGGALALHSNLMDLATREIAAEYSEQHTVVRTDFGEDEWFLRETTLIPVDGSLWWFGARKGGIALRELDGQRLKQALIEAVGPFSSKRAVPATRRAPSDLVLRVEPVKA